MRIVCTGYIYVCYIHIMDIHRKRAGEKALLRAAGEGRPFLECRTTRTPTKEDPGST